jgi:hypothetical protein
MKCERCGEEIMIRHPYLSRADDKTEICWFCGEYEAYLCINMLDRKVPKEEKIKALKAFLNTWVQEYTYNDVTYLRDGSVKWVTEGNYD